MASTTEINDHIERGLFSLTAEVDWLPNIATVWDCTSENERMSILLDWEHLFGYLPELRRYHHAGVMTDIQAVRYRQLLWKLSDAIPLFRRIGLPLDDLSVEP